MKIRPFRKGDTHSTFQNLIEKTKQEIDALENDYILKASSTELEQYYIGKVSIMPLVLHSDQYYIDDQKGTKIDVSHDFRRAVFPGERAVVQGTQLDIAIPYEGDPVLWGIRASTFSHSPYPELDIRDDTVVFTIQFPDDSANSDTLKKQIDSAVQDLTKAVGYLKNDVEQHNASAPEAIKMAIERKRQKALSTTNAVANLGIQSNVAVSRLPSLYQPNVVKHLSADPLYRRKHINLSLYWAKLNTIIFWTFFGACLL